jgi:hypothetical protein
MSQSRGDFNTLNDLVKEYLAYHGLTEALETFKAEESQRYQGMFAQKRGSAVK